MAEKLVEVDEQELLRLRRAGDTVAAMLKTPAARKKLAAAMKDIKPDDPLAKEADQVDPIEARFDELSKANAALAKQISDDNAKREHDARISSLQSEQDRGFAVLRQAKWTDDGIAKVKKVMEEKGILDVAIAANWVESQMPLASPINPSASGSWGFMEAPGEGADDIKKLIESKGENVGLLHKMAGDAIAEVRGTSRR